MKRRTIFKLLGLLTLPASSAFAQSSRPIRVVVPLSPGTPSDAITRTVTPGVSAILGQTVIVDNKPGANGVIGAQEVMRAPPDGQTLLMGSVSPLAINMAVVKNLPYDPRRDFTPIAAHYASNHVWAVNAALPVRTMAEFIAYTKAHPATVTAGHSTALMKIQLAALEKMADIEFLQVPYKATNTSITDMLGGTLNMTLLDMGTALAQAKNPKMRLLAISPQKRSPLAPDWPSVSETVPGYDFASWAAFVGPPNMPRDVVNRLNGAINQVLKQKEISEKMAAGGVVPLVMTPDELKAFIDSEVSKWVRFAQIAKIEPE